MNVARLIFKIILTLVFTFIPAITLANTVALDKKNTQFFKQASFVNAVNPNQIIEFKLWLKLRNQAKLDKILHDLYTPGSSIYHKFLTPAEFRTAFFPTEKDNNILKNYFTNQGFAIISDSKKHFYLRLKGSVQQIEKTFHTKINYYQYRGKIVYANAEAPQIDEKLSTLISGITGLNNIPQPNDKCIGFTTPEGSAIFGINNTLTANLVNANGNVIIPNMTFKGFIPQGTNNAGYTPAQIQRAYGVDQLISQSNQVDGTGQSVVIVDACQSPSLMSDINKFVTENVSSVAANDLPAFTSSNFTIQVYPSGGAAAVCDATDTKELIFIQEQTLDLDGFHTMAPGANIFLALSSDLSTTDVNTVLSDVVADMVAGGTYPANTSLITMSYSQPETSITPATNIDSALLSAAGIGVSVDISSGDCGNNTGFSSAQNIKSVNYPSSSPWVTAVGATALFFDTNGNYSKEIGWGNVLNTSYTCYPSSSTYPCAAYQANYTNLGFTGGTTGGLSNTYAAQAWQQNAISSLYAGGYGIVGSFVIPSQPGQIYRAVPDVSMYGENHPGFEYYVTIPPSGGGAPVQQISTASGTSLATPFFTAILALVNEERSSKSKGSLGLASQYLYNLPAGALHVISNPHGMGNPVAGVPNPNAFQLYQLDSTTGTLYGIVYNLDTTLTLGAMWNDVTGVGSPYAPIFVPTLASK